MNVGFYTILKGNNFEHIAMAKDLIASVRKSMPGVPVVQFTNMDTPKVPGVDEVVRKDGKHMRMAVLRMEHHASVEGDWLFVDTDVEVLQDVRDVFALDFDVAVTDRSGIPMNEGEKRWAAEMPYNMGVTFSRCPAFWREAQEILLKMPNEKQTWMGDQHAVCELVALGRYKVNVLSGGTYNYPPRGGDLAGVAIAHYKGARKALK